MGATRRLAVFLAPYRLSAILAPLLMVLEVSQLVAGYQAGKLIATLIFLAIPVGIILLVVKLARGSGKKRRTHNPPPIPR